VASAERLLQQILDNAFLKDALDTATQEFTEKKIRTEEWNAVATQDRVFPYYAPNSSIKHSKSDSKDRSQEIL
jgi:hypothetical protein